MILSTVNFVARPKSTKSSTKGKDGAKKTSTKKKTSGVEEPVCCNCGQEEKVKTWVDLPQRKEQYDSYRTSGYVSDSSNSRHSSTTSACDDCSKVAIETDQSYFLSVDPTYYNICLRKLDRANSSCIFRKRVLKSETKPNGKTETAVFYLDCDPDYYITTTGNGQLELNMYNDRPVSVDQPDERFFNIYETATGFTLIQPCAHKGLYLHHLDDALSLQKFDLNLRPPEEYFYNIRTMVSPPKPDLTSEKMCKENTYTCSSNTANHATCETDRRVNVIHVTLPNSPSKTPQKFSLTRLFTGCFSGKSQHVPTVRHGLRV